ncbi:MAG: hypothetical protein U9M96_05185 [Thermodesulfobacteriota bacterium]|nr:hypothetical protein [Thermodesulfobacteriota bacterium]
MKKVWITSLAHEEKQVQNIMAMLKTYALDANGHFWLDDLKKMAWLGPRAELIKDDTALWIILSSDKELASESVRYGLSMLALSVHAVRGHGFPIIFLHDGKIPSIDSLPTPFQGTEIFAIDNAAIGAKLVAKANMPLKKVSAEYRLDIYAIPQLGQWFEVGPFESSWKGAMFGVCGAEIDAHGAGPAGKLPDRSIIEYPMQGLKLAVGEKEYVAWAVQNQLDPGLSYYVRVQGEPKSILLGQLAESDDAEVYILNLQ